MDCVSGRGGASNGRGMGGKLETGGLLADGNNKGDTEAALRRHLVGLQLQQGACTVPQQFRVLEPYFFCDAATVLCA